MHFSANGTLPRERIDCGGDSGESMTNWESDEGEGEDYSDALPIEMDLGDYRITGYLGRGSFGITYRARELKLRRDVAIKEYMPREWARRYPDHSIGTVSRRTSGTFRYGLDRFTMEAQNLAACRQENIVKVHRLLEQNCTSYMVMELLDGETLEARIARTGKIAWSDLAPMFRALIDGCRDIHRRGILHRDIKPANIVLRESEPDRDEVSVACQPVLIDFGAARELRRQGAAKLSTILTEEYAPLEQWSDKQEQGPYTDVYALAATISHALTGIAPTPAPARKAEGADSILRIARNLAPDDIVNGLDHALRLEPSQRPQNMDEWMAEMPSLLAVPVQGERRRIDRRAVLALAGGAALAGTAGWLLLARGDIKASARPLHVAWARAFDALGPRGVNPAIAITGDGALVVASLASGDDVRMLALQLDRDGNEQARWLSPDRNAQAYTVRAAPGGGAFVGGGVDMLTQDGSAVSGKGLLVRLGPGFSELWRSDFEGAIVTSLIPRGPRDLLAAFDGVNRSGVAMLQRVSDSGQKVGAPIELNDRRGDSAKKVIALPNGTFAVLGLRDTGSTSRSIWVSCVDPNGRELWRASSDAAIAAQGVAWSEGWDLAAAADALFVVGRGVQSAIDTSEAGNPQLLHHSLVMRLDLAKGGDLKWLRCNYEPAPVAATANASARCVAAIGAVEPAVYLAGWWHTLPYRGWLRQIGGEGDVVWTDEAFGPQGFVPTHLQLDEGGGYAAGIFTPNPQTNKLMVVRLAVA